MAAFAYVLLLAIVALGVPLGISLRARVNDEVRSQAAGQAGLVAATAADLLTPKRRHELQVVTRTAAEEVRGRVLVVDHAGTVLADSAVPPETGSSYARRPEIASALRGRQVQVQRPSNTLGEQILATAAPVIRNGATVGAVRVTQSVAAVSSAVRRVEIGLAVVGAIVLAIGLAVAAVIAQRIARPLGRLERVARQVADGDLAARAEIEGTREQRSLGASFNEMTDRVGRLLDSQREFVADASHQLRTPLTGLRLRIDEARAAGVSKAAAAELDAGVAEVDRLARIVDELIVLSRAGERELPGDQLDLNTTVEHALERWRAAAAEKGIRLQAQRTPGARVWCAGADADRVLDVLIENALQYAPADSTVTVASAPGCIRVTDRGPGLGSDESETLFERFHRGSAGRGGPAGSGLGLSIARDLAREWGGEVTLENRNGGGAVATFELPSVTP